MPYQSTGKCRFLTNDFFPLQDVKGIQRAYATAPAWFDGNPSVEKRLSINVGVGNQWTDDTLDAEVFNYNSPSFCAIMGHNLGSGYSGVRFGYGNYDTGTFALIDGSYITPQPSHGLSFNGSLQTYNGESNFWHPTFDGFTIFRFSDIMPTDATHLRLQFGSTSYSIHVKIGAIYFGSYMETPHSPDLKLSLSYDYSGVKTIETKGGASLSNTTYTAPPMWINGNGAWELANANGTPAPSQEYRRSGRRIWDLNFSFLAGTNALGPNQSLSGETNTGVEGFVNSGKVWGGQDPALYEDHELDSNNYYETNLHSSVNLFSIIDRCHGSRFPFLFQPDTNENVYAICKLDMKSFKFDQVANGVYSCKIKLREVW